MFVTFKIIDLDSLIGLEKLGDLALFLDEHFPPHCFLEEVILQDHSLTYKFKKKTPHFTASILISCHHNFFQHYFPLRLSIISDVQEYRSGSLGKGGFYTKWLAGISL